MELSAVIEQGYFIKLSGRKGTEMKALAYSTNKENLLSYFESEGLVRDEIINGDSVQVTVDDFPLTIAFVNQNV